MDVRSFGKVNSVVRPPTALSRVHFVRVLERVAGRQVQDRLREQLRQPADHVADRHHADRPALEHPRDGLLDRRRRRHADGLGGAERSDGVVQQGAAYFLQLVLDVLGAIVELRHDGSSALHGLASAVERPAARTLTVISPLASAVERPAARTLTVISPLASAVERPAARTATQRSPAAAWAGTALASFSISTKRLAGGGGGF